MAKTFPILSAKIEADDDAATNTVVADPGDGFKIRVLGYVLALTGAGTAKWQSGASTELSGDIEFVDAGGATAPLAPVVPGAGPNDQPFWFECNESEALNLVLTGASALGKGHVTYQIVPV
jgi:hypothetical protein